MSLSTADLHAPQARTFGPVWGIRMRVGRFHPDYCPEAWDAFEAAVVAELAPLLALPEEHQAPEAQERLHRGRWLVRFRHAGLDAWKPLADAVAGLAIEYLGLAGANAVFLADITTWTDTGVHHGH